MNLLARSSLLIVALLVSGFSFGFAPVRADELPEDTNKIKSLTPEQARKLAEEFPGVDVEVEIKGYFKAKVPACLPMNGLKSLDAETAKSLAGYDKGPLLFNGLTTLDAATAKALAEYRGKELSLSGLTTLDAASAKALAEFKGQQLSLDGLTTLDADTTKALAEFKGDFLFLSGLTTLDAATAMALAEFKGKELYLDGLPTLDAATAMALAEFKGKVLTEVKGLLHLNGLTTLDTDTAKALAESKAWDGGLSAVTALDSPDSIAIAKALTTRKGPLSLPNLKKISPKTLTALIQKKDVEIPLIDTLELIPEPDGSTTDDFVIPEWLEERQKQQRAEQAAE